MTKIIQSIPYPTYTTAQRDALTGVLLNTKINNSTTGKVEEYNGYVWVEQGSGTGATNLAFTGSSTNGIVTSDTGSDATIPLGNGTNSGLSINDYTTTEKNKLANIAANANVGVVPNVAITPGTFTKVTIDAKGLATSGNSATTADIAASTNKNYITDAQLTALHPQETATTIGALIGEAGDATPNDTDYVATSLVAGGILKKITWTNVKAFLKTYFDTLYKAEDRGYALSDNTSDITVGNKLTETITRAYTLTDIRASLGTASSGTLLFTVNVKKNGASIFSTKLTFDFSETTTVTATTPHVFTSTTIAFAVGDILSIDVDQVGMVAAGKGLILFLTINK